MAPLRSWMVKYAFYLIMVVGSPLILRQLSLAWYQRRRLQAAPWFSAPATELASHKLEPDERKEGKPSHRVVSLLPAATEILAVIGGESLLVGRGHEDDYPPAVKTRPIVTAAKTAFTTSAEVDKMMTEAVASGASLYELDEDVIKSLRPSVILTQSLCSVCAISEGMVHRIAKEISPEPAVVSLSPNRIEDIIADVMKVGKAVGLEEHAARVSESLNGRMEAAKRLVKAEMSSKRVRVVFMEWTDPIYCGGHWTPQLIEMAGGAHPLNPSKPGSGAGDSFRVSPVQVEEVDPDWIIVCPCGLDIPTTKKELAHVAAQDWWKALRAVKERRVVLVDGNQMFNRSGPRLVDAFEWLVGLLNHASEIMPASFPWEYWVQPSPQADEGSPLAQCQPSPDAVSGHTLPEASTNGTKPRANEEQPQASNGETSKSGTNDRWHEVIGGTWSAPVLEPDIEEAHRAATCQDREMYKDPKTGYSVFTSLSHSMRGYCCGKKCRHCPYGHFAVGASKAARSNVILEPILLANQSILERSMAGKWKGWHLLYWTGDAASWLSFKALCGNLPAKLYLQGNQPRAVSPDQIVLVTCFEKSTGRIYSPFPTSSLEGSTTRRNPLPIAIRAAMDQCLHLELPLLAIPLEDGEESPIRAQSVAEGVQKRLKLLRGKVKGLALPSLSPSTEEMDLWTSSMKSKGLPVWLPLRGVAERSLEEYLLSCCETKEVSIVTDGAPSSTPAKSAADEGGGDGEPTPIVSEEKPRVETPILGACVLLGAS